MGSRAGLRRLGRRCLNGAGADRRNGGATQELSAEEEDARCQEKTASACQPSYGGYHGPSFASQRSSPLAQERRGACPAAHASKNTVDLVLSSADTALASPGLENAVIDYQFTADRVTWTQPGTQDTKGGASSLAGPRPTTSSDSTSQRPGSSVSQTGTER